MYHAWKGNGKYRNLKERNHLEYLDVYGRTVIGLNLQSVG
jgi:hypothetical protein